MLQRMAAEEKTTLVVVTHDARIFGYADRIANMNDGRIVEVVAAAAQAA
jgi:putative ABC transport system ATP-binding protein